MTNLSGFDLNLMRVLSAMLDERSTIRAGEKIGLSQPAVSAALGRLRHALGDPLFVREGQRMVPTEFCIAIEPNLRAALDQLAHIASGPAGFDPATADMHFLLSGSDLFAEAILPPLARRIRETAAGIRIGMVDTIYDTTLDAMERFGVDLAFWPKLNFPSWIDHEELFDSEFVVCAARDHPRLKRAGISDGDPIGLDLYCDLDHVTFVPDGKPNHLGDKRLSDLGRSRRIVATVSTFQGVYTLVAGSGLIGGLPRQFALRRKSEGLITTHPTPIDLRSNRVCMYWHRQTTASPAHIWLRNEVRAIIQRYDAETESI